MDIQTIHDSLINGQRKQMVEQIHEYCHQNGSEIADFFSEYNEWLTELWFDYPKHLDAFVDMVVSYHRINR